MPRLSYMDIGSALGNYGNTMSQGYKDAQDLALKNQQIQALYPGSLPIPYEMAKLISQPPLTTNAAPAMIQGQNRVNESVAMEGKPFFDQKTRQWITPSALRSPPSVQQAYPIRDMAHPDAQETMNDIAPNDRDPASMNAQEFGQHVVNGTQNIMTKYSPESLAKQFDLNIDANGNLKSKNLKQGEMLYDLYKHMVSGQASIFAAGERPMMAPSTQILTEQRPAGNGSSNQVMNSILNRMKDIESQSGIKSKMQGFDPNMIKNPTTRQEYINLQQRYQSMLGNGAVGNKAVSPQTMAPQVPQDAKEVAIKGNANFKPLVSKYQKEHGVDQQTAEKAVLDFLKTKIK